MIKLLLTTLTALAVLTLSAATACELYTPIGKRIESFGSTAEIVVLVEVESAAYTSGPEFDYHPWEGSVVLKRILKGHTETQRFKIRRSGSVTACDDKNPVPKPGDLWILYLQYNRQMQGNGDGTYPLDVARGADPRLEALLTSGDAK